MKARAYSMNPGSEMCIKHFRSKGKNRKTCDSVPDQKKKKKLINDTSFPLHY